MVKVVDWGYMTDEHQNAITLSAMETWKDRCERTIKELSQFDNEKPEELESEFDHFDLENSYATSPSIVDLNFAYEQLLDGHKACKITSSLTQYRR